MSSESLKLVGRSSSHYTRVVRIVAHELGLEYRMQAVKNIYSLAPADYGGNPALKVPTLELHGQTALGSMTCLRVLSKVAKAKQSATKVKLIWPELLTEPASQNAYELTVETMATEASLLMSEQGGVPPDGRYRAKLRCCLNNSLSWLEGYRCEHPSTSSTTTLDIAEVYLFCLIDHLEFKDLLGAQRLPGLVQFRNQFAERLSAQATPFFYDA